MKEGQVDSSLAPLWICLKGVGGKEELAGISAWGLSQWGSFHKATFGNKLPEVGNKWAKPGSHLPHILCSEECHRIPGIVAQLATRFIKAEMGVSEQEGARGCCKKPCAGDLR